MKERELITQIRYRYVELTPLFIVAARLQTQGCNTCEAACFTKQPASPSFSAVSWRRHCHRGHVIKTRRQDVHYDQQ